MEYKLLHERLSEFFDTLPSYARHYDADYYHILSDSIYNKEFCMRYGELYVTWYVKNIFFKVDEYGFIAVNSHYKFKNGNLSETSGCKRITTKQAFEFLKRNDNFVKLLKQIYK